MLRESLPFVVLPCVAACAVGWAVRHWLLAAATAAGAVGLLYIVAGQGPALVRYGVPLVTGAGLAGLALLPVLALKPLAGPVFRIVPCAAIAFAAHFLFLQYAMATR
ncbi:hypothetical protein Ga0609869_000777 [Rhodovulum iodosum]|uniref:Uncharacterized protein n=1 Tax=Rhodovulum iodosum TaxID=68291 RepID=A0ABV3XQ33_9RHOB|nr:hypothetical protein [Rhodovulum robiginosum]RSK31301.1 hypothetical protein EJA01_14215 [Rhodovulum robiginosum]